MKWYCSVGGRIGLGPIRRNPVLFRAQVLNWRSSRPAHRARRKNICPARLGFQSRNRRVARNIPVRVCARHLLPSHSRILLVASGCAKPCTQSRKIVRRVGKRKNNVGCGVRALRPKRRSTDSSNRSANRSCRRLRRSRLYWSLAWHFGHSPLMKRSGRNIFLIGS